MKWHLLLFIILAPCLSFGQQDFTPYDSVYANGDKQLNTNQGRLFYSKSKQLLTYENHSDTHMAIKGVTQIGEIYKNALVYRNTKNVLTLVKLDYLTRLSPLPSELKTTNKPIYQILSLRWDDLGLGEYMLKGFDNREGRTVFIDAHGTIGASLDGQKDVKPKRRKLNDGWYLEIGTDIKTTDRYGHIGSSFDDKSIAKFHRLKNAKSTKKTTKHFVHTYNKYGVISHKNRPIIRDKWRVLIFPDYDTIVFEENAQKQTAYLVANRSRDGLYFPHLFVDKAYMGKSDTIGTYLNNNGFPKLFETYTLMLKDHGCHLVFQDAEKLYFEGEYTAAINVFNTMDGYCRKQKKLIALKQNSEELLGINFRKSFSKIVRVNDFDITYSQKAANRKEVIYFLNNHLTPDKNGLGNEQLNVVQTDQYTFDVNITLKPELNQPFSFTVPTEEENATHLIVAKEQYKKWGDTIYTNLVKLESEWK